MSRQRANHYDRSRSRRTLVFAIRSTGAIVVMCVGLRAQPQPATSPEAIFGGDPKSAAVLRARGLELGYNLDHADALDAFVRAMAADPADPAACRLAAGTAWMALLFEQGAITVDDYLGQARADLPRRTPTAALDAAFRANLQRALTLSEERLRRDPDDADAHYQVGAAYGFLASYSATVEGRVRIAQPLI